MAQWLYKTVYNCFHILGSLPESVRQGFAVILGRLFFALDKRHRNIAKDNLSRAFSGEKTPIQIHRIARSVFENLCRILFEIGWALSLKENQLHQYFSIYGIKDYQNAMAKGKGVLLLVAHFGNWELLPIVAHMAHMPVRIVYRAMDNPFIDRFFKENRSRFGGVPIATHKGAMRKIYRALRHGYPVGMLMDQGADWYDGVFVDFFNRRAATNIGMALLALKSEAPVVPLFLIRKPNGFHAILGPELPLIKTGDHTKDIEKNTQQYNRVIEAYIRKYPDQWFWIHQRWKNRPYWPWPRKQSN